MAPFCTIPALHSMRSSPLLLPLPPCSLSLPPFPCPLPHPCQHQQVLGLCSFEKPGHHLFNTWGESFPLLQRLLMCFILLDLSLWERHLLIHKQCHREMTSPSPNTTPTTQNRSPPSLLTQHPGARHCITFASVLSHTKDDDCAP